MKKFLTQFVDMIFKNLDQPYTRIYDNGFNHNIGIGAGSITTLTGSASVT